MKLPAHMEALRQRMRQMSAADLSVLEAGVSTPDSCMQTSHGSDNDALWSEMLRLGWMTRQEHSFPLPDGGSYSGPQYTVLAAGRKPISRLLELVRPEVAQVAVAAKVRAVEAKTAQLDRLTELHNQLYRELAPRIIGPIRAAGGDPIDVFMLLERLIVNTIGTCVAPQDYERALDHLVSSARRRLSAPKA